MQAISFEVEGWTWFISVGFSHTVWSALLFVCRTAGLFNCGTCKMKRHTGKTFNCKPKCIVLFEPMAPWFQREGDKGRLLISACGLAYQLSYFISSMSWLNRNLVLAILMRHYMTMHDMVPKDLRIKLHVPGKTLASSPADNPWRCSRSNVWR